MKEKNLSKSVMREIKDKSINIRSKYAVLAEKLGLGSSLALLVVLVAILINLVFYWFKISGDLNLLVFGKIGLKAFFESFPYIWVIMAIGFFIIAALLIKKYDISYKKPYIGLLLIMFISILLISGVMVVSGLNENLERGVQQGKHLFLKPFWGREINKTNRNSIIGEIVEIKEETINIKNKEREIEINYDENTRLPKNGNFQEGEWIRAIGEYSENEDFQAKGIIIVDEDMQKREMRFKQNLLPKPRFR